MDEAQMKQHCLELMNAAIAIFDLVEEKGIVAPLEDLDGVMKLKSMVDHANEIREYYYRRNIQRMLALGVSPESLLKMAGDGG